jgi:hypothetical protein
MAMSMMDRAMLMTVVRRLLDERRAVTSMDTGERNGIRRTDRTESEGGESRCSENRLHTFVP